MSAGGWRIAFLQGCGPWVLNKNEVDCHAGHRRWIHAGLTQMLTVWERSQLKKRGSREEGKAIEDAGKGQLESSTAAGSLCEVAI